jgi:hypothetical protein
MNRLGPRFINGENVCICAPIVRQKHFYSHNTNDQNKNRFALYALNQNTQATNKQVNLAWKHFDTILFEMNKKEKFEFNLINSNNSYNNNVNATVHSETSDGKNSYSSKSSYLSSGLKTIRLEVGYILSKIFNFEFLKMKYEVEFN